MFSGVVMNKPVTIKDVAKRAGVSIAAVSTAFSNKKSNMRLSETTRRHILDVAQECNYSPNIAAKGFQSRKSYLLGFFFARHSWYLQMGILQSIRSVCQKYDYDVIVYPAESLEEEKNNLQSTRVRNLDGILTIPFISEEGNNLDEYRKYAACGIRVVQVISKISDEFPLVGRDYHKIGYDAVKHLAECGHRQIGHVTFANYEDQIQGPGAWQMANGCRDAASECGVSLQFYPIPFSDMGRGLLITSEVTVESILKSARIPTALVTNSLKMTYGVYNVLVKKSIRIPEDISLLCCGDDTESFFPPDLKLSYYEVPVVKIGEEAAKKCLNLPDAFQTKNLLIFHSMQEGNTIRKIELPVKDLSLKKKNTKIRRLKDVGQES